MDDRYHHDDSRCAGCGGCAREARDQQPREREYDGPSEPGQMPILAAVGFFLVPALLAVIGAMLTPGEPVWQLVGAVAGLAAGAGLAGGVSRWLVARRSPDQPFDQPRG